MSDTSPPASGPTNPAPAPAPPSMIAEDVQEAETFLEEVPSRAQIALFIAGSIARTAAVLILIFLSMSLIPKQVDVFSGLPIVSILIGMAAYLWYTRRQLKKIDTSRFPQVQAIETLIMMTAMFLALFSIIYVSLSQHDNQAFTERLDAFSAYYFSLTVLATVGFGDITPITTLARSVTMVQMAIDLALVGILVRIVSTAASRAISQRKASQKHHTSN